MYRLLIWGTGNIAEQLLDKGLKGDIIGFVETEKHKDTFKNKKVYAFREIPQDYDYIIIANSFADEIYDMCLESKMDFGKIIFITKNKIKSKFSDLPKLRTILGEANYAEYCSTFGLIHESFFAEDMQRYNYLNTRDNFQIDERYLWPVITDKYATAGSINNYFWQDLWAARLIYKSQVKEHFDIGSRIDGFIAHLLAMDIDVSLIDIREFPYTVEKLHTIIDDATTLRQIPNESIESMSALCSLEHFGLGRYGDPVDPEACFKCFDQIQQKIRSGGQLYLSVPIGVERVEFNAHRVFYASTIVNCFAKMQLKEFSCTFEGKIEYNVDLHKYDYAEQNGDYRYGLFYFEKP